jgi:ABC-type sugar transport system permease subunit
MIRKRGLTLRGKTAWAGRLFILPWIIGVIWFFIIPLVQSIYYTISRITISSEGLSFQFVGLDNYLFAFTRDPDFLQTLAGAIGNIAYQVPIIVFFSLFVSLILREKFVGRSIMRAIFFFPVIIASGVVITILKENVMMQAAGDVTSQVLFRTGGLGELMVTAGLNTRVVEYLTTAISQVFDLTWKSGVQILLILAALYNIPESMYEAADIEGATAWEKFWKITFTLISPTILLAVIYSIIDYFTDFGNQVMRMIVRQLNQGRFEYSTTIAITYFISVMIIIAIINFGLSKRVFYVVE